MLTRSATIRFFTYASLSISSLSSTRIYGLKTVAVGAKFSNFSKRPVREHKFENVSLYCRNQFFHSSRQSRNKAQEQQEKEKKDGKSADSKRGSLIPTRSHLLRLILPLPSSNSINHISKPSSQNSSKEFSSSTPPPNQVSFLLHPTQPLSHLSSLILAELPRVRPSLNDSGSGSLRSENRITFHGFQDPDPTVKGDEEDVRWSLGTELGEFMRDAAKVREFRIRINSGEGEREWEEWEIVVGVPNFEDRTKYMRETFHSLTTEINSLAKIKFECDTIAHQHTKHVALTGFAALVVYWGTIYYLTFQKYGWDIMEPITYLTGLGGAMVGYLWFLYHNRNVSYRSVFQHTTAQRQGKLYQERGFDEDQWIELIADIKKLGREIRTIAEEYGVKWDPKKEAMGRAEGVLEKEERKDRNVRKGREKKGDEDEDED